MARTGQSSRAQRDATDFASDPLMELSAPLPLTLPPSVTVSVPDVLGLVQDQRQFSPEGLNRAPLSVSGNQTPIGETRDRKYDRYPSFTDARNAVECHRRKERREVLFAKRRTRSGAGKRKRRDAWSNVHC